MSTPLQIRFATDTEGARSAIASLAGSIAQNMVSVGSAVKAANDNLGATISLAQRMSAAFTAALPAIVAIAGAVAAFKIVEAATDAAKASIEEFVAIAAKASDAGVSAGLFQRWTEQAKDLNTETAKLVEMLNRAREAATVRIGEGDQGASSTIGNRLRQNVLAGNIGQGDLDRFDAASSQEAKIRVVLDLIRQLQDKGAQLAALDLAGKMFGPEFENKMRAGVDMVAKLLATLDSTALTAGGKRIISDDELRNAQEISDQLNRISDLMSQGLAPIQRDLVELGQASYRSWLDIQEAIAGAVAKAGQLYSAVKGILDELDKFTGKNPLASLADALGAGRVRQTLGIAEPDGPVQGPQMPPGGIRLTVNPKTDASRSLPSLNRGAGAGQTESKDEIERLIAQMDRANEVARAELDTVGKTNVEREKALGLARLTAASRAAGRDATEEEREQVERLAEATARVKDATMDAQQRLRETAEMMREFGQLGVEAFSDMIVEGKSLNDVVGSIAKQLARAAIQAAIMGTGPLAGFLGTSAAASAGPNALGGLLGLLGGGGGSSGGGFTDVAQWHAAGGLVRGAGSGTSDSIPARLSDGEFVVRAASVPANLDVLRAINARGYADGGLVGRMRGSMSGGSSAVNITSVVDARGSDMNEGRFSAILNQRDRRLSAQLSSQIRDLRGRGAI